eukprot:13650-Pelagococcus_subviridis.AAC.3
MFTLRRARSNAHSPVSTDRASSHDTRTRIAPLIPPRIATGKKASVPTCPGAQLARRVGTMSALASAWVPPTRVRARREKTPREPGTTRCVARERRDAVGAG